LVCGIVIPTEWRGGDAPYHPIMPELIGKVKASQGRQRLLVRAEDSHHVVVFHSEIVLVEAAPVRDKARADLRYGTSVLTVASHGAAVLAAPAVGQGIQLAHRADTLLTRLLRWLPSSQISARLEGLDDLQPEALEREFPGLVRRLPTKLVTSATLNRFPFG